MSIRIPIDPERLRQKSLLQKYFGDDPKENAFVRAKNLVLGGSFDKQMIDHISSEYAIDVACEFRERWEELFRDILYHLFKDGDLDAAEKAFAKEYVAAFRLSKANVETAIQSVGRQVFIERLLKAIGPDGLDKKEDERLSRFAKQLGLRYAKNAYVETVSGILQVHLEEMLEDDLLTPMEIHELNLMAKTLRIGLSFSDEIQRKMDAAESRWAVMHEPLQRIEVDQIRLDRGEDAFHVDPAEWFESRRVRSGGESYDQYKVIYSGCVILTDKRILMLDDLGGGTKTIKWNALLAVRQTGQLEVELVKSSGKSPILKFGRYEGIPSVGPIVVERLFRGEH